MTDHADEAWAPVGPYGDDDPSEPRVAHGDDLLVRLREVADHGGCATLDTADIQILFTILDRAAYAERAEVAELRSRLVAHDELDAVAEAAKHFDSITSQVIGEPRRDEAGRTQDSFDNAHAKLRQSLAALEAKRAGQP